LLSPIFFSVYSIMEGGALVPEVVIVGVNSVGKSELLEALVGQPLNYVEFKEKGATKRTLFLQLISSEIPSGPKLVLSNQTEKHLEMDRIEEASMKIRNSNDLQLFSLEPIRLQYESRHCFNITLIDTPGLSSLADLDEHSQMQVFLEDIIRPSHRLIVYVQEANQNQWDASNITDRLLHIVKRVDPYGKRTVYVYNKFFSLLDTFYSSEQLARYLQSTNANPSLPISLCNTSFWITLFSTKERLQAITQNNYLEQLSKLDERDRVRLDLLHSDVRFSKCFGTNALRHFILNWCWQYYYQHNVPALFKAITLEKAKLSKEISKAEDHRNSLNLRQLAAEYASRYLYISQSMFVGISKGNPSLYGETLKEEIDEQFFSSPEWEIKDSKSIPFPNVKLYGGQQLERLLSEFRCVASRLQIEASKIDSLPRLSEKHFFWMACEAVEHRLEELFVPLIEQLLDRTRFILSRFPVIVESLMTAREGSTSLKQQKPWFNVKHFVPLATTLRDMFRSFIEKNSDACKQSCMDEFYSIKTIVWFQQNSGFADYQSRFSDERTLVQKLFSEMKERITRNVLRKLYNLFLMPFMGHALWQEIQTHIFCLDSSAFREIFDANAIEDELQQQSEELEHRMDKLQESESKLKRMVPRLIVEFTPRSQVC